VKLSIYALEGKCSKEKLQRRMVYTLCVECTLCVLQGFQDNETKGPHHVCISELDNNNKNYQIYFIVDND
jgi:hypothetical protein